MNIQDEMNRIFKMQKDNLTNERKFKELDEWEVLQNFLDGERKSSEDEERNLYCVCGELKTACPDGYAHTTGGA
jgi:hypothetical protein